MRRKYTPQNRFAILGSKLGPPLFREHGNTTFVNDGDAPPLSILGVCGAFFGLQGDRELSRPAGS
jgi:hypothetical protein